MTTHGFASVMKQRALGAKAEQQQLAGATLVDPITKAAHVRQLSARDPDSIYRAPGAPVCPRLTGAAGTARDQR